MDKNIALSKAYFFILVRFIIIFFCLVALYIQHHPILPQLFSLNESKLLVIMLVVNVGYILVARFFYRHAGIFIVFQIALDLLAESLLIYLNGGIVSIFVSLYFGSILAAGILLAPSVSFVIASLATISIAGIALTYFLAAVTTSELPWLKANAYPSFEHDFPFLKSYLFAQGLSFHLVALFINWLSGMMNRQRILHAEILENLSDGVLVTDEQQNIFFINQKAKDILQYKTLESPIGKPIVEILDSTRHSIILKMLLSQEPCQLQIEFPIKDALVPISLTLTPFATAKKIRAYILILRDISDQKRMEEAVKRANRLATISEIAATIAHEIRNPLASIRGAIQELRNSYCMGDDRYILMDIALRESDRLNRIISDFLQFSKLRMPNMQQIALSHLLEEFIFFLKKRSDMADAQIHTEIEPDIVIAGDSEQLKQAFYNIAINALEAAIEKLHLTIRVQRCKLSQFPGQSKYHLPTLDEMGVLIQFQDQGKGIASQHKAKIFTPFFTTKEHGTGMGLASISKIVDLHQGLCHLETIANQGTIFSIWLPSPKTGIWDSMRLQQKDAH